MYIVTKHNKVIDICGGTYATVGTTVVCESCHRNYMDAVLVDIGDTRLPEDILCNDYYYYHGSFVRSKDDHKSIVLDFIIVSDRWVDNTYTIDNVNITPTNVIELLPSPIITKEQADAFSNAMIVGKDQSDGSITLVAFNRAPDIDIPVTLIFRRDN